MFLQLLVDVTLRATEFHGVRGVSINTLALIPCLNAFTVEKHKFVLKPQDNKPHSADDRSSPPTLNNTVLSVSGL